MRLPLAQSTPRIFLQSTLRIFLLLALSASAAAQHRALVPQPRQVHYGEGTLPLRGLSLCFSPAPVAPAAPAAEDRFTAGTLAQGIAQQTGLHPSVDAHCPATAAILLHRTGAVDPLPGVGETAGPDSREAYRISITRSGVEITGRSSAAVYYGALTLLSMIEGAALPVATVSDWPALAYRGTLVDVGSEGPMSTVEQVKRQLDIVAHWRGNQFYFYSEGNIELKGYPLLNPDARFTQDDVSELIAYARARHIDVVPAVEMYGHLHDLLRIEKYSTLSDFPHGGELDPSNPQVRIMLADWVDQISELFPSPFADIGFDETWGLQKAANGADSDPVQLFIRQLATVTHLFQSHGKTVIAYADIMVKFPGIVPRLPKGLIAMPWWYTATPDPEYKHWLQPLVDNHVPHIILTGVSSWDEIAPNYSVTFDNIDTFLAAGRKSHALGMVNSVWTDDGQMLMRMSWPGIAYGAAAAWQDQPVNRDAFLAAYTRTMFNPAGAPHIAEAIREMNASEVALETVTGDISQLAMWWDPFAPATLAHLEGHAEALRQCRLHAEAAEEQLMAAIAADGLPDNLASMMAGARMLDYTGEKFLYALEIRDGWKSLGTHPTRTAVQDFLDKGIYSETHSRCEDLMDGISGLQPEYASAWRLQYTGYRLNSALGRWQAEYDYWRHAQEALEAVHDSFKDGDTLPPLDTLLSTK